MVSSTKAPMSIRPTTDQVPPPTDHKRVVSSEKPDKACCYGCSKQIVDRVQLPQTQCGASAATQVNMAPANSSTLNSTDNNHFVCNICLDGCEDPVVTHCGHLFCWPCLFCWLSQQAGLSHELQCPVCKANVRDKIIPLYNDHAGPGTRRADHTTDSGVTTALFPDMHIPSRPLPNRCSDVPPATGTAETEYYTGRDSDFYGINEDHLIVAEGMQFRSSVYNARPAELPISRRSRLTSKKQFVLHWAFICTASIATVCFVIAC